MADTTITIKANPDQAIESIKRLEAQFGKMGDAVKSVGQIAEAFQSVFVFEKIKSAIESVVEAYAESERASNSLTASLQAQGMPVEEMKKKYEEIAGAVQKKTVFEEDSIIAGMASMQSMIGQREITEDLTMAVANFAAVKKMDVVSAFELVSKSIGGEVNALGRYGIEIDSGASKSEKLVQVTEALSSKFSGQAEAQTKGLGSLKQLHNAFKLFEEELGSRIAPAVSAIANELRDLIEVLKNHSDVVMFTGAVAAVGGSLYAIVKAANVAKEAIIELKAVMAGSAGGMTLAISAVAAAVVLFYYAVQDNWGGIGDFFTASCRVIFDMAEKIMAMASAVGAFFKAMVYQNSVGMIQAIDDFKTAAKSHVATFDEAMTEAVKIREEKAKASADKDKERLQGLGIMQKGSDDDVSKNKQKLLDDEAKAREKEEKEYSKAWFDSAEAQHKATIADINAAMDARLEAFASLHRLRLAQIEEEDVSDRTKAEKAAKEDIEFAQSLADFKDKQLEKEAKREEEKRARDAKAAKEALEIQASGGLSKEQLEAYQGQGNIWRATGAYDKIGPEALAGGAKVGSMMDGAASSLAIGSIPVVGQILAAADKLVGAAQAIVDFLPNLLNKSAALVDSITKFPDTLLTAIQNFVAKFADNLKNSLPNLLQKLPVIIDTLISAFSDSFPQAIEESIPLIIDALVGLIEKLPELVVKFYTAYITVFPKLVTALVKELVPHLPAIAAAFMKAIYIELPKAIWQAIGGALAVAAPQFAQAGRQIMGGLGFAIGASEAVLGKAGSDIWSGLTTNLIGEGGGLFGGLGADIWNGFKNLGDIINAYFISLGSRIWDGLSTALVGYWENFAAYGAKIFEGFSTAIAGYWDNFENAGRNIFVGFQKGVLEIWDWFETLGGNIAAGFKNALGNIGGNNIGGGIGGGLQQVGDTVAGWMPSYNSEGGIVPAYLAGGAFLPRGTDTIPAMLSPGERVLSTSDNKSLIAAINQGQNVNIVLEPRGSLQEIFEKLMVKASVLGTGRISLAVGSES